MKDDLSQKYKEICGKHFADQKEGCAGCPLQAPCKHQIGDNDEVYAIRMNKAAEELK